MSRTNPTYFAGGVVIAVTGAVFFSTKAIFVKLAYRDTSVDAVSLLALRMLFSLPFFLASAFVSSRKTANVRFTPAQWAAVAFVGSDGGIFRFNTIYLPTKHLLRILQEHRAPDLVRSRNGVFTDNIVYWSGDLAVNVGDMTDPETFTFARNWWYRRDVPRASRPALPSIETRGVYGADPQFRAPPADLRALAAGGRGVYAAGSGSVP